MKRKEFINQYTRINRKFEDIFLSSVQKAVHEKVKAVIVRLREGGVETAQTYLVSDLGNPAMTEAMEKLYKVVGLKHAQLNYSRLLHDTRRRKSVNLQLQSKGFGFNSQWAKFIIDYLRKHLVDKITFRIAETTRDALLRALTTMTVEGLGVDGMIERLEDWPYERFQAARIVRTEVNRAANTGATAQASTSEWQQLKEWIAIHDNRTRGNPINGQRDHANHWDLDRQKINEDDVFVDSVNGDRLMFPGDPNGTAASVINCRCAIAYTFKRDEQGNLIPKRRSTVVLYPNQIPRQPVITV